MQSPTPDSPIDVSSRAALPGWRLKRLEIRNWGTFNNQVHLLVPDAGWTLLVGENGSGKSTAADALRTLLVPPRLVKDSYNDASGATKGRDRSRRSYILGAWGSEGQEDSIKGVTKYLRTEKDISTLLAVFVNEALKKSVTLAQILWLHGDAVHELFAFSHGDRSIKADLSDFGSSQIREFKTKLEKRDFDVHKSFSGYANRFTSAMNIPGEEALEVFNQAIGVKDVADPNIFIRRHMLEPSDAVDFIDSTLRPHFTELTRCWESIETAKKQLEQLNPIAEWYRKMDSAMELRRTLDELGKAIPVYYAHLQLSLRRGQEVELTDKISKVQRDQDDVKASETAAAAERDSIRDALSNNAVALRLDAVKSDLKQANDRRAAKHESHGKFLQMLKNVGINLLVTSADEFDQIRKQIISLKDDLEEQQSGAWEESNGLAVKLSELASRIQGLTRELVAAREHKVSIPEIYLTIRSQLCLATSIPSNDLPFAGELIEVKDEFSAWRGAIERLLYGFAISMIVPSSHYREVSQWVDSNHLRARFTFLLVVDRNQGSVSGSVAANRVAARLQFRKDHFLHAWVATEVSNNFRHVCVDNPTELQHENNALTLNGLIKGGASRHTKDDRTRIDDPSNWVLGWSAEAKIRRLEGLIQQLIEQKTQLQGEERALKAKLKLLQDNLTALSMLAAVDRFDTIDYFAAEIEAIELARQRDELQEQAEPLKNLLDQRDAVDKKLRQLREKADELVARRTELETDLKTCTDKIGLLATYLQPHSDFSAERFRPTLEGLQETQVLEISNIEEVEDKVTEKVRDQITIQEGIVTSSGRKILPLMTTFLTNYPAETSELKADIDFAKDFVALRDQLETERLPQYRDRFRSFLDENLLSSLANFRAKLDEDENNIRKRIVTVNEALKLIQFTESTYVEIRESRAHNAEIADFRRRLGECFDGTLSDSDESREAVLEKIRLLMDDFNKREDWKRRVTDVRNWLEFAISEKDRQTGKEVNYVSESSGRSGGQKAKMAFTILASAIMSQYGLASDNPDANTFRFVVIDEAFSRTDEENSRQALDLFQKLGLQLLVVSPFDARARLVEDYVDTFHLATNPTRDASRIARASRDEYEAARDSAPADANEN